jgi:hypothetical protein
MVNFPALVAYFAQAAGYCRSAAPKSSYRAGTISPMAYRFARRHGNG